MDADRLNNWLGIAANIGVLVGIVILAAEVRQNSEHLAVQLEFQTSQKIYENNRDFLDPDTARVFAKAITRPEEMSLDEVLKGSALILNLLGEWEERYFMYEAGLIDDAEWRQHVARNIEWTLGSRFARVAWEAGKSGFEPDFTEHVDGLLDDVSETSTLDWWLETQSRLRSSTDAAD